MKVTCAHSPRSRSQAGTTLVQCALSIVLITLVAIAAVTFAGRATASALDPDNVFAGGGSVTTTPPNGIDQTDGGKKAGRGSGGNTGSSTPPQSSPSTINGSDVPSATW